MGTPKFGGAFTWESLACRFFQHDIDPLNPAFAEVASDHELVAIMASLNIDEWGDIATLAVLPDVGDEDVASTLFHEQVHYWQIISSPLLQSLFLTALQKIRLVVNANGGRATAICGEAGADIRLDLVTEGLLRARTLMSSPFTDVDVRWQVEIVADPPTDVAALSCRLPDDDREWPGFVAALGYGAPDRRLVQADLCSLTESSALASEMQRRGQLPGELLEHAPPLHDRYLGLWELWRRYHHGRAPEVDLVYPFVAVLDMALLGGVPGPLLSFNGRDDFPAERFSRLLTASGQEELPSSSGPGDLRRYQEALGKRVNLVPVDDVVARAKRRLLRILVFSLGPLLGLDADTWETRVNDLWRPDPSPVDEASLVRTLDHVFAKNEHLPLGAQILATMYNALCHRTDHPDHFVAPAQYEAILKQRFPLPIILMRGRYYMSQPTDQRDQRITVWPGMLRLDILRLTTLLPLVEGRAECGFVESGAECLYTAAGLGCPRSSKRRISDEAVAVRKKFGTASWCHRTQCDLITGMMRGPERDYWLARASAANPEGNWRSAFPDLDDERDHAD